MNYGLAYNIGFHPWEDAANDPVFVAKFRDVIAREEVGRNRPFGAALDIGTGSGIWGIELAKRGWQVTGIDNIQKALDRARERVQQSGVNMQLIKGDVTAIRQTGISTGFRLILDTGTFHDFNPTQQRAMGHGIDAIAAPDGVVLLLIWPRRIRPLIRGADRAEIQAAFPNWRITHVEPSHFKLPKLMQMILRPDEQWYRLSRIG
jgi:cyclopropane fatty-acyl-phospholipid synthase-like methyltransferase